MPQEIQGSLVHVETKYVLVLPEYLGFWADFIVNEKLSVVSLWLQVLLFNITITYIP